MLRLSSPLTASATQAVFLPFLCKQGVCMKQTTGHLRTLLKALVRIFQRNHPCTNISLPATSNACRHWRYNQIIGRATEVLLNLYRIAITKTTENLNNIRSTISTRPTAHTSPQQRAASTHFTTDELRFSTKSSSKTAKRIFFHRLVPFSNSCSTGMFIVHAWRRHFFYARTAHDRDAAPDWRTTLSDSAAGRGTCSRSIDIPELKLIAKALELDIDAYSGSLLEKVAWLRVHF